MKVTLKHLRKQLKEKRLQIRTTQEKLLRLKKEERKILQITEVILQLKTNEDLTTTEKMQTEDIEETQVEETTAAQTLHKEETTGQIPQEEAAQVHHCWYDICSCPFCIEEEYKVNWEINMPKRKKKNSQQKFKEQYESNDPAVELLGEPSEKYDFYVLYSATTKAETTEEKME